MYYVTVLDISDVADPVHIEALNLLSVSERERYNKYFRRSDANLFLLGRYLTRHLIAAFTGTDAHSVEIVIDEETGKPHAKDWPILFSISHSGRYVAVGIADKPIGVDIQIHNQTDFSIFESYFTTEERAYAAQLEAKFYRLWTSIEALAKITGIGFNEALAARLPHISTELTGYRLNAQEYYLQTLIETDEATLTVAAAEMVTISRIHASTVTGLNRLCSILPKLEIYSAS